MSLFVSFGDQLVTITQKKQIPGTKWMASTLVNGKRAVSAVIYQDNQIKINYCCGESELNGVTTGKGMKYYNKVVLVIHYLAESLQFYSRDQSSAKELDHYLTKMAKSVRPITLSKISDLISNLRPIYPLPTTEQEHG